MAAFVDELCKTNQLKTKSSYATNSCNVINRDPCVPSHNEYVCHMMGEKRQHYLSEVKKILDRLDTEECPDMAAIQKTTGTGGGSGLGADRPMIRYPGYIDMESPKFKQTFYAPMITNVPIKEIRPTSSMQQHKNEDSPILQYIPVENVPICPPFALPRKKSFELRASIMHRGCDCAKHNGLQDQCERSGCEGDADCLNKPEPTCVPSQSFVGPPRQRPKLDMVRHVVATTGQPQNKTYCCCSTNVPMFKKVGDKRFKDCNFADGPGQMECYTCRK